MVEGPRGVGPGGAATPLLCHIGWCGRKPTPDQRSLVALVQGRPRQQIWPALGRAEQRLVATPARDAGVVTRAQHLRHYQAAPGGRFGVYRGLEQASDV